MAAISEGRISTSLETIQVEDIGKGTKVPYIEASVTYRVNWKDPPHAYFSDSIEGKAYTPDDLKHLATDAATSNEPEAWWVKEFINKPPAAPNVNADIRVPLVVLGPGLGGDLVVNLKPTV